MVKRLLESGGGGEKQVSWLDVYERDAYEPEISDFLEKKNRALRRDILTNCQCEISDALSDQSFPCIVFGAVGATAPSKPNDVKNNPSHFL